MHLLPDVLISKEEPDTEVLCGYVFTIQDDQLADSSEHDILDRFGRDATQVDHKNRSISHPVIQQWLCYERPDVGVRAENAENAKGVSRF